MSLSKNLVEGWEEDMSISASSESSEDLFDHYGNNEIYINELEKFKKHYSKGFEFEDSSINDINDDSCNNILDFEYIHDQDMNYYQETYRYSRANGSHKEDSRSQDNDESMLGPIAEPNVPNEQEYDPDFDKQINDLLDNIDKDLETGIPDINAKDDKNEDIILDAKKEQYEDYYNEFPDDDDDDDEKVPAWYDKQLKKKVQDAKITLDLLGNNIYQTCSQATRDQIRRMEQDHNSKLCQIDYPRHPSLRKPWTNYWKFICVTRCKVVDPEIEHAHTFDCEVLLLEHVGTSITTQSNNIFSEDFPQHVMHVVELFQKFAEMTSKDPSLYENDDEIPDTVYEKPTWTYIKIRSNYKKELQLSICGKGVKALIPHLQRFFDSGPGRSCNVVSLYCTNVRWSQKKGNFQPILLSGIIELRDKVGPIKVNYTPKTNMNFNSIQAIELGKLMSEYLAPTADTTFIDIGCDFGVLSLMLSYKCDKVIGLNPLQHEVDAAENLARYNTVHNATFITCNAKDVFTKCSPLVKKCMTVASLDLSSPFGKSHFVYSALRNMPSVWRVAVYGSLTREIIRQLQKLTMKDDYLGDEFVPMRSCILDKSPSVPNAYDVVILFERKSLIEPSIELISSGPTVNVYQEENWDSDGEDMKVSVKKGNQGCQPKFDAPSLPSKTPRPEISVPIDPTPYTSFRNLPAMISKKTLKFYDCPSLPVKKETSNESTSKNDSSPDKPSATKRSSASKFDCPSVKEERSDDDVSTSSKDSGRDSLPKIKNYSARGKHFFDGKRYSKKDRTFDCVSLVDDQISASSSKKNTCTVKTEKTSPVRPSTLPEFDFLSELPNRSKDSHSSHKSEIKKERRSGSSSPPSSTLPEFDFLSDLRKQQSKKSKDNVDYRSDSKRKRSYDSPSSPVQSTLPEFDFLSELPNRPKDKSSSSKPKPNSNLKIRDLKRMYDSPSGKETERHRPLSYEKRYYDYSSESLYSSSSVKREITLSDEEVTRYNYPSPSKVKKEKVVKLEPKKKRIKIERSTPEEKEEGELSSDSESSNSPITIKKEPVDRENEASTPVTSRVKVKTEPVDNSDSSVKTGPIQVNNVVIKTEPVEKDNAVTASKPTVDETVAQTETIDITADVLVKTEPGDVQNVTVKTEPTDAENVAVKTEPIANVEGNAKDEPIDIDDDELQVIEPPPKQQVVVDLEEPASNLEDIENMKTPVRVPGNSPSPPPATANFTTIDGFAFSVKPNQSFLSNSKADESTSDNSTAASGQVKIKQEKVEVKQEKVEVKKEKVEVKKEKVTVKQEKVVVKQEPIDNGAPGGSGTRSKKKSEEDNDDDISIIGERRDVPKKELKDRLKYVIDKQKTTEDNDDLRRLIEQRKILQKQLGVETWDNEREPRRYRQSSVERLSPSPPTSRRSRRSPSPYSSKRYRYSPTSPTPSRYRRSPSPLAKPKFSLKPAKSSTSIYKYRHLDYESPPPRSSRRSPSPRFSRSSPPPPSRYSRHSPSPSPRHSRPSPPSRRYPRHSPSPPPRYSRRSPSPVSRFSRRSPSASRYPRRSPSPYKFKRSPISPVDRKPRYRRPSRSPSVNNRRTRSPSRSPLPSTSKKHRDLSPDDKKKKKKKRRKRESSEEANYSKVKTKDKAKKTAKNSDVEDWDSPVMSKVTTKSADKTNGLKDVSSISSTTLSQESSEGR